MTLVMKSLRKLLVRIKRLNRWKDGITRYVITAGVVGGGVGGV